MTVFFYTAKLDFGGSFTIKTGRSKFNFGSCHSSQTRIDFPTQLPTATDKIWKITKTRNSESEIGIVINCNDVEVLNVPISKSTCGENTTDFLISRWRRVVEIINFGMYDTASEFYWQPFSSGTYYFGF